MNLPGRGEVFVRDSGGRPATPAVLLLHGWTASADINFFPAYACLAEAYRVIALDLRGHGRGIRSTEPFSLEDCADDAATALQQLDVGRTIVVGYSMGGAVGLLLARRHPEQVAALVMQATALEWRRAARERAVWHLLPVLDLSLRFGAGARLVERLLREGVDQAPELDRYQPWLAAEFQRATARDLVAAGRALSRYDARPWAGQLDVPAAVLVTTRDRLVRSAKQRELANALGACVFEIDADHDLPLLKGDEYALLTRLAVDKVAAAAGLAPSGLRLLLVRPRVVLAEPVFQVVKQDRAIRVSGVLILLPRPVGLPEPGLSFGWRLDGYFRISALERQTALQHGNRRLVPDGHPSHHVGHGAALRMPGNRPKQRNRVVRSHAHPFV
jgi:3-oxoadipate enol-lactonase